MKTTIFKENSYSACLLFFCFAMFIIIAWKISPFLPDDSYISFRYAKNLAYGGGLTFNTDGMPVEGYTSFLWILFCALIARIGFDLPFFTPIFGGGIGLLCILVFWFIIRRRQLSTAQQVAPLLLLSCSGPFVLYSVSGMETPLFSLLILLGILCFDYILDTGHTFWFITLSIVSFLLALCRPEGVIFFPLIVVLIVLKNKLNLNDESSVGISYKWLTISFALFVFLMVVYELWRIYYFGEYFPTPFLSKGVGGRSLLSIWATNLKAYFVLQNHYFAPFGYYYFALMLLSISPILGAIYFKKQLPIFEIGVFIIALVYVLVYMNFADWMPGMRYHTPIISLFLISGTLLLRRTTLQSDKLFLPETLNYVTIIILILTINFSFVMALRFDAMRNEQSTQKSLVAMGKWLKLNVPSNTLLAISDVGATPYYSELPTLDSNPNSLTDIFIARNGWSNDYFFEKKPGIAIFVSFSLTDPKFYEKHFELLSHPKFSKQYRLIGKTRYDWYQDRSYWIYAHNSIQFTYKQLSTIPQGIGH